MFLTIDLTALKLNEMGKKKSKKSYVTKINTNDPLNWWNKFWIGLALLTIIIESVGIIFFSETFQPKSIMTLSLGIPFSLMIFQYRQLRKTKVYKVWFFISLFVLGLFIFSVIDSTFLTEEYKHFCRGLKAPILFMIAFYIFRKMSISICKTEPISPPRYSRYDPEEGRKANYMDYITFTLYWPIIILAHIF